MKKLLFILLAPIFVFGMLFMNLLYPLWEGLWKD